MFTWSTWPQPSARSTTLIKLQVHMIAHGTTLMPVAAPMCFSRKGTEVEAQQPKNGRGKQDRPSPSAAPLAKCLRFYVCTKISNALKTQVCMYGRNPRCVHTSCVSSANRPFFFFGDVIEYHTAFCTHFTLTEWNTVTVDAVGKRFRANCLFPMETYLQHPFSALVILVLLTKALGSSTRCWGHSWYHR